MSLYQITGVRTAKSGSGTHDHISDVQVTVGTSKLMLSRATVVTDLRSVSGDRYYTYGGGEYADVTVASCPTCGYRDYITTEPDSTTANNLLHLPRV